MNNKHDLNEQVGAKLKLACPVQKIPSPVTIGNRPSLIQELFLKVLNTLSIYLSGGVALHRLSTGLRSGL